MSAKKILAVASGGGHWIQLMRLRPAFEGCEVVYISTHEGYQKQVNGSVFYAVTDANRWNKIIASADLTLTGVRYARVMAPEKTVKLPFHPNLNMGIEYRYTPEISFWVKCNNISYSRYFEWNYYPSRNLMLLGGISYSL